MLKKAGLVVAAATVGLFALSPLAFADSDHEWAEEYEVSFTSIEEGNLSNDCEFDQSGQTITNTLTGGSSLLGAGGLVVNALAPVSAPVAAANCVNVGISDVIDSDSNNVDVSEVRTEIEDSFNGFPFED